MITDGQMEILLGQSVLGPSEQAAHPKSVVTATVEVHEIGRSQRIQSVGIVVRVRCQLLSHSVQPQMVTSAKNLQEALAKSFLPGGLKANEGIEIWGQGHLRIQIDPLQESFLRQSVQTDSSIFQANTEMGSLSEADDSIGQMLQ